MRAALLNCIAFLAKQGASTPACSPKPAPYALLLPQGLEAPALELLRRDGLDHHCHQRLPSPVAAPGFTLSEAGALSTLLVTPGAHCNGELPEKLLRCPCVAGSVAVIASSVVDAEAEDAPRLLQGASWTLETTAAAVKLLWAHCPELQHKHTEVGIRFRVACSRGGRHRKAVSSVAICSAVADALTKDGVCATWTVDLKAPDVRVVCILAQDQLLIGLLLPPLDPGDRSGRAIPRGGLRSYLPAESRGRPHMAPFVAASLVHLAGVRDGQVLLDPCGGLGVIPIEAALQCDLERAVSVDIDPQASALAAVHAELAGVGVVQGGPVAVQCGSSLELGPLGVHSESVDLVVTDLPFGRRHDKLDVSTLLRALWPVLKPRARMVVVGDAGTAKAVMRCVQGKAAHQRCANTPWAVKSKIEFAMGGIETVGVFLVKVATKTVKPSALKCS